MYTFFKKSLSADLAVVIFALRKSLIILQNTQSSQKKKNIWQQKNIYVLVIFTRPVGDIDKLEYFSIGFVLESTQQNIVQTG